MATRWGAMMLRTGLGRLTLALLGAACLHGLPTASATDALIPVKVGIPGDSIAFGPWFVAQSGGFFTKNGLDVQFVFLVGNALPAALESNGIQATPMVGEITFGNLAGFKVRPAALLMSKAPYMIVAKDTINTVADLKGKVIATSPPKGTPNALLGYFLAKNGLDPAKDVKLLFIGSESARRTLVLTGQADAIIEDAKGGYELEDKLSTLHTLVPPSDMPPQLIAGVSTSDNLIKTNPDLLKRLMRALADADDFVRANPDKTADMLGQDMKMTKTVARKVTDAFVSSLSPSLVPTEDLYVGEAKLDSTSRGKDVTPATLKGVWDTHLAAEVEKERAGK